MVIMPSLSKEQPGFSNHSPHFTKIIYLNKAHKKLGGNVDATKAKQMEMRNPLLFEKYIQ
jgi:hypothetical protein